MYKSLLGGAGSHRGALRSIRALAAGMLLGLVASTAHALPSYARQTGVECAACHVGGYGPQLTPYGVKFKIGGYTTTDGKDGKVPLSAMMVANWTHTEKDAADGDKLKHFRSNDNAAMQEASVFLAGRLAENIGSFVQVTYSGIERKRALDQADVRYARTIISGDKEMTLGLSLNTNPTLTDPLNTLGQWRFPFVSSEFNAGFGPSPLIESLASGVIGANAYMFFDNHVYAEAGLYNTLSEEAIDRINADDPGKFKGLGKYMRLAYLDSREHDNFSVGLVGFDADLQPDRTDLGTGDKYRDAGVDASYQFIGDRQHIFALNASYMKEWQKLDFTAGTLGAADKRSSSLDQVRVAASYHFAQTWGVTAGYFDSRGDRDVTRNANSLNGRPNTSGYILQADWTPGGKKGAWGAPWANVRFGVQYTGYERFMGGSTFIDADGNERRARDNNTTMLFMWVAI